MRKLGVILILAGLALAYGPAWFAVKISGEEISQSKVYERSDKAWVPTQVALSENQNPLRVRVDGYFLPGGAYFGDGIPLVVMVRGKDGEVLSQSISLSTANGNAGRIEGGREVRTRKDGTVLISTNTDAFYVSADGMYQITVVPDDVEADFSLSSVEVITLENVTEPGLEFKKYGFPLAGLGLALFFIGGRSRKRGRAKRRDKLEHERELQNRRREADDDDNDQDDDDDDDEDDDDDKDRKSETSSRRKSPWDAREPRNSGKPKNSRNQSSSKKSEQSIWKRKEQPAKTQPKREPKPEPAPLPKPKKKKPSIQWGRGNDSGKGDQDEK